MTYTKKRLRKLYNKTSGDCHLCGKKVCLCNYGKYGKKGACEVDHSKAKAKGGSDDDKNLFLAHISCNRSKSIKSTRSIRASNGLNRAPYSLDEREDINFNNKLLWGTGGFLLGLKLNANPLGLFLLTYAGIKIGDNIEV